MKMLSLCLLGFTMMLLVAPAMRTDLVKRSIVCFDGWSLINGRCFYYVAKPMTWAKAERHCQFMGANLASVHSKQEYSSIQWVIRRAARTNKETWIGGSNAQEPNIWLWSDGSIFSLSDWCAHEPSNYGGSQRCLQMNHSDKNCWDDLECYVLRPSVCARKE